VTRGAAGLSQRAADGAPPSMRLDSLSSAYCNLTVPKQTWAVSNPSDAAAWIRKYMPVQCEAGSDVSEYSLCDRTDSCGSYVRLALNGSNEGHTAPCFGIHLVHAKERPEGSTSIKSVEKHFDSRMEALDSNEYDAFMDFALVLYANSLDTYIDSLAADDVSFMLLRWQDNCECVSDGQNPPTMGGQTFFSLVVHVPGTQINFELVSSQAPSLSKRARTIVDDDTVRLPHTAMSSAGAAPPGDDYLLPLSVSKGTSDIEAVTTWYNSVLQANSDSMYEYAATDGSVTLRTIQVRLVCQVSVWLVSVRLVSVWLVCVA